MGYQEERANTAYYHYMLGRAKELEHTDPTLHLQAEVFYGIILAFTKLARQYPGMAPMPPE